MNSLHFLGSLQVFSSDVGETTVSDSLPILTTDDGLGCEEVIDTKTCSMTDTCTQVVDIL